MNVKKTKRMAMALFSVAIASSLMIPNAAFAVVNLGTVSVSMQGSVSVASGSSVAVAAYANPAYSDQLPNCMNSYCPSGCDFGNTGQSCEDKATGQCTCYGYGYSRYYPSCTVSSSDSSVARASWSGGTLSIAGYAPGTATITVYPSMRLFSSAPASIEVNVYGQQATAPTVTPSTGGSSDSGSGQVSAAPAAQPKAASVVSVVSSIAKGDGSSDSGEVESAEAEDTFHIGDEGVSIPELLAQYAGTDKVLSLWGGDNEESPQYIWEIPGSKLSADADLNVDLTISKLAASEGKVGELLSGATYSAFTIPHEGDLPGTMQLFWRTADLIDNDAVVDVYWFDEASSTFEKVYSNLKTAEGYVCFNVAKGGTFVVSEDSDLEGIGKADTGASTAAVSEKNAENASHDGMADGGCLPFVIGGCVVVAAGVGVAVLVGKKRSGNVGVIGVKSEEDDNNEEE